jgi:p-aminobenzoyl-glutamate transporter AbgT
MSLSALTRFLGDSPLRVILKLLVVSFLVGLVMNAFGWSPMDVLQAIQRLFTDLWNLGFHAIDRFLGYILLGAAIVVPAFILVRLANYRK